MSDFNQVIISGRLGADPEARRLSDGKPVVNLRVACSETWRDRATGERKEKTEWIPVSVFNEGICKVAETYLKKGSKVLISGQWKTRKWTDQAGQDKYSTELVLGPFNSTLQMLDGKSDDSGQRGGGQSSGSYGAESGGGSRGGSHDDDSDPIPF